MWTQRNRQESLRIIYVKNLDKSIDNKQFFDIFSPFGRILSCDVTRDGQGNSKGFGFVHFETEEVANKAIEQMNGVLFLDKKLYVGNISSSEFGQGRRRYTGVNLYVKNLDDTIDDEKLREAFSTYGTITSAKVIFEDGRSKGFGFVCFSSPEEATKAATEMNGRVVGNKPIYVALAQRKDRTASWTQHMVGMRMPHIGQVYPAGYYMPTIPQPQRFYTPPQMAQLRPFPRWPAQQPCPGAAGHWGFGYAPFRAVAVPASAPGQYNLRALHPAAPYPWAMARPQLVAAAGQPRASAVAGAPLASQFGGGTAMRAPAPFPSAVHIQGQEPLPPSPPLPPEKQFLGEHLYPLIHAMYPNLAAKLTGMLLELDNQQIMHFFQDHDFLRSRVEEAVAVLYMFHQLQAQAFSQN